MPFVVLWSDTAKSWPGRRHLKGRPQRMIQNNSGLPQGLAGRPSLQQSPSVAGGHSSAGGRPMSDMTRREFIALIGGAGLLLRNKLLLPGAKPKSPAADE